MQRKNRDIQRPISGPAAAPQSHRKYNGDEKQTEGGLIGTRRHDDDLVIDQTYRVSLSRGDRLIGAKVLFKMIIGRAADGRRVHTQGYSGGTEKGTYSPLS